MLQEPEHYRQVFIKNAQVAFNKNLHIAHTGKSPSGPCIVNMPKFLTLIPIHVRKTKKKNASD